MPNYIIKMMALPPRERPLCFRISSEMYHAVFEAIVEASTTWKTETGNKVFNAEKASEIATRLCFKIAEEVEGRLAASANVPADTAQNKTL